MRKFIRENRTGRDYGGRIRKRILLAFVVLPVLSALLSGCESTEPKIAETVMEGVESSVSGDRGITLYRVTGNTIEAEAERLQPKQPDSVTACLEEVMGSISLMDGMHFLGYTMGSENAVTLSFQTDQGLTKENVLLGKAAVVSTISQIRNIGEITLSMAVGDGEPKEEKLQSSSFYYYDNVIPTGQNNGRITLYMPEGEGLSTTTLAVTLQLDVSVEEEVVRQLIERNAFMTGTRLHSVSVIQRVAYVDVSEEFLVGANQWTIASLVDSVSTLPHIGSVQILINGEKRDEIGGVDTHVPLKFFIPQEEK